MVSTARDLATFGQTFLNGGAYGDTRLLTALSVDAMTCNQVPGMSTELVPEIATDASWGLGWSVRGQKRIRAWAEVLMSPRAFSHGGSGGAFLWVDPEQEIVGVYLSVESRMNPAGSCADLLVNAVTAAIDSPMR